MKCNIGKTDRIIRIIAGITILLTGLLSHSWLGFIGFVPLATGLIRWCPAYVPFGISTDK